MLLRHASSIVARLQAAQADLQALRAGESGTLRVGIFQSAGARVLPEIMRRFTEQWPEIDVTLVELEDDEITVAVERGEIDVGFVLLPVGDHPLETVELLRDPYVLIVPDGLAARRRRAVAARASSTSRSSASGSAPRSSRSKRRFAPRASSRTGRSARTTTRPCRGSSRPASGWRSCHG